MLVNSTELQNNFGKYLHLAGPEDIFITRNGIPMAKPTFLCKLFPLVCPRQEL